MQKLWLHVGEQQQLILFCIFSKNSTRVRPPADPHCLSKELQCCTSQSRSAVPVMCEVNKAWKCLHDSPSLSQLGVFTKAVLFRQSLSGRGPEQQPGWRCRWFVKSSGSSEFRGKIQETQLLPGRTSTADCEFHFKFFKGALQRQSQVLQLNVKTCTTLEDSLL